MNRLKGALVLGFFALAVLVGCSESTTTSGDS
jgi:hypothetical protein